MNGKIVQKTSTLVENNHFINGAYQSHPKDDRGVDFITIVAHQLRTPLTAIKWYTDLLLAGKVGKLAHEQRDFLLDIYQSNERMIRLVDNLLIIEQLEQDVLPMVRRLTNITRLISNVVNEYQTFAKVNNIDLIHHCDGVGVPQLKIDPIYMRLAIKNILDNALRYTPKRGAVALSCEVRKQSLENYLLLKISDTGIGIPDEERDKVFDKFYRSPSSVSMQTEGTGLGLYIARVIIEKNGGTIRFTSKASQAIKSQLIPELPPGTLGTGDQNQGTTFYIEFPVNG